jgi:prepilin-type N-terminal cleavage/methylation domain-containing protein
MGNINKNSFTLIEIILVIAIIAVISSQIDFNYQRHTLKDAADILKLHLNYTRYIAHIDNKEDITDNEWKRKLWTLKFQRCSSSVGGLYYVIYTDKSGGTAHFKKEESLKEPLTNRYLYSNSDCKVSKDESDDVLITQKYEVSKVEVSCNNSSSIGQISFGFKGGIYNKLGAEPVEITKKCFIKLYDRQGNNETITVEPYTGFVY